MRNLQRTARRMVGDANYDPVGTAACRAESRPKLGLLDGHANGFKTGDGVGRLAARAFVENCLCGARERSFEAKRRVRAARLVDRRIIRHGFYILNGLGVLLHVVS
eukprot:scaffold2028_cov353-Pavlova_lutheri.AAC.14